jgi:hypothetical protein
MPKHNKLLCRKFQFSSYCCRLGCAGARRGDAGAAARAKAELLVNTGNKKEGKK